MLPSDRPPAPGDGRAAGLHAGQDGAGRDQTGQQRDGVGPLPSVGPPSSRPPTTSTATPTTATSSSRAPGQAPRRSFAPEHVAVGCGSVSLCQQLDSDHRVGRRRGDVRLAQLRDLPAAGARRRRDPGPGTADRPHLRPGRDAGRDHRAHPADLRLQPEQPDLHRGRPDALARFVDAVPSTSWSPSTRPTSNTSATACCPTASGWSVSTPMSLCCGHFRRPTDWPACGWATRSATRRSSPHWARSTCRSPRPASPRPPRSPRWTPPTNCWPAPTRSWPNGRGSAPHCARRVTLPPSQANFVWLPLGPTHGGLRRQAAERASGAPVRPRRCAGHHRRAGRERRFLGVRPDWIGERTVTAGAQKFDEFKSRTGPSPTPRWTASGKH